MYNEFCETKSVFGTAVKPTQKNQNLSNITTLIQCKE